MHWTKATVLSIFLLSLIGISSEAEDSWLGTPLEILRPKAWKGPGFGGSEVEVLCQELSLGCGVERSALDDPQKSIFQFPRELRKQTPQKILDSYVAAHPVYKWSLANGIINVEPKQRTDEDFLSRHLDSVSIHGVSSLRASIDALHQAGIPVTYQSMGAVGTFARVELDMKNVTVREVLNEIAKRDTKVMWVVYTIRGTTRVRLHFMMPSWRRDGSGIPARSDKDTPIQWVPP